MVSQQEENINSEQDVDGENQQELTETLEREFKFEGEYFSYVVSEVFASDKKLSGWNISAFHDNQLIQTIEVEKSQYIDIVPELEELLCEKDVNFDGKKDLLIMVRNQEEPELKTYICYIADEKEFTLCPGFSMIQNPDIDEQNKLIVSDVYHHQVSYSKRYYKYNGGVFEMVREDLYNYNKDNKEYVFERTFDSTIPLFTESDNAIAGKYIGVNNDSYSISIYSDTSVEENGNEIGNFMINEEYACLYKVAENIYFSNGYELHSAFEENTWIIRIYDKNNVLIDELKMVQHYES